MQNIVKQEKGCIDAYRQFANNLKMNLADKESIDVNYLDKIGF
jgi:hypothetical protein